MRDQVQQWLSACMVAGHDTPDGDNSHVSFEVDAPTLESLCRAWLALDGAATGTVEAAGDDEAGQPRVLVHSTRDELAQGPSLACQRVRIVKEARET